MKENLQLHFYVEDVSTEVALHHLIPRILKEYEGDFEYRVFAFRGKRDLLTKLPDRLKPYPSWIQHTPNLRIIVLVDRDDDDCSELKQQLETIASHAGMITRTANPSNFQLINRIVIEELEAWFFGDVTAMQRAYPKVPESLEKQKPYRDPDAIKGGTWEALERVLRDYHHGGLGKVGAAEKISKHMNPDRNRSKSFQVFRDTLRQLFM